MHTQTHLKRRKMPRGQSMVEFALAFPIFLLIVFAIFEFGRLFITYTSVYAAAREGARFGAAVENLPTCGAGIQSNAERVGFLAVGLNITHTYDSGPGTPTFACASGGTNLGLGDRVLVTASVTDFESITGLFPPIDISSQAKRTIIKDVFLIKTLEPPSP
ncbi:MAG: TadE/TadG family type IV pilus assembly protein [Bellilinea sp.]